MGDGFTFFYVFGGEGSVIWVRWRSGLYMQYPVLASTYSDQ